MSTAYSKASVIIPNSAGVKAGTLQAWRPDVNLLQDIDVVQNTANASRVNEQGLIEFVPANTPRWDWSEGLSCPSLLVEPQRTNLQIFNQDLDPANSGLNAIFVNVNPQTVQAPDGTNNASEIIPDTSTGVHRLDTPFKTATTSTEYSASYYVKDNGQRYSGFSVAFGNSGSFVSKIEVAFDLADGTQVLNNVDGGVLLQAKLNNKTVNGFKRVEITVKTPASGVNQIRTLMLFANATGNTSFTGDGTSGVYAWGYQIEEGGYVSSVIPTEASIATRNADVISKTGIANLIGQSAFSNYFEVKFFEAGYIEFSDGTSNNVVQIGTNTGFTNYYLKVVVGGVTHCNITGGNPILNTVYKLFGAAATNDAALIVDGNVLGTDTTITTFAANTLTKVDLSNFKGKLSTGAWWKSRLINIEGQSLTT